MPQQAAQQCQCPGMEALPQCGGWMQLALLCKL